MEQNTNTECSLRTPCHMDNCASCLRSYLLKTEAERNRYRAVLELVASPKRPDGTYNRDREACELIAKEALCPKK